MSSVSPGSARLSVLPRTLICLEIAVAIFLLSQQHARVNKHDLHVEERMVGANGDARIQFIVVRQDATGENEWGPQGTEAQSRAMLVFFDRLGRETGKFKFPSSPPTGGTLMTLVATEEFAVLPGAPQPDVMIPPLLNALGGKVCFKDNPSNRSATPKNECVSYGSFTGNTEVNRSGESQTGMRWESGAAVVCPCVDHRRTASELF